MAFAGNLHKAYTAWCDESGEQHAMRQTAFGMAPGEHGYHKAKSDGRNRHVGIGLSVADYRERRYG